jgi:hypothetical protein
MFQIQLSVVDQVRSETTKIAQIARARYFEAFLSFHFSPISISLEPTVERGLSWWRGLLISDNFLG